MTAIINSRRRWFGLFFLLMALGMLIWGQTLLAPHLRGEVYVLYWTCCLLFTLLALFTAILDARITRKQIRQQQLDLLKETLGSSQDRDERPAKRRKPN